jgi:hypothetical protein
MKRISLDIFRIGKTKDERKTRFEQSNEDRVNMNFKRLQQAIEEVNAEKSDSGDVYTKAEADTLLSAKANSADVVPKSGGTFTGDVTFDEDVTVRGVLDVTQRRCYGIISAVGWYRLFSLRADTQASVLGIDPYNFHIVIARSGNDSETHEITLAVNKNSFSFTNEVSKSLGLLVDKIRITNNGAGINCDIHYASSSGHYLTAYYDAYTDLTYQSKVVSENLASVADAPSGETVLTTYDFSANLSPTYLKYVDSPAATYTVGSNHYVAVPYPTGLNGLNVVSIGMVYWSTISGAISIMPYNSNLNEWYIIGESGATITNAQFRYWYI